MADKDELEVIAKNKDFMNKLISISYLVLWDIKDAEDARSNAFWMLMSLPQRNYLKLETLKGGYAKLHTIKPLKLLKERVALEAWII